MNIRKYFKKIESISAYCESKNMAASQYIVDVLLENKEEIVELINSKKQMIEVSDILGFDDSDWQSEFSHEIDGQLAEKYVLDSVVKDIEDLCITQKCYFPLGVGF